MGRALSGGFTHVFHFFSLFSFGGALVVFLILAHGLGGAMMHIASVRATQILFSSKARPGKAERMKSCFLPGVTTHRCARFGSSFSSGLVTCTHCQLLRLLGAVAPALTHASELSLSRSDVDSGL
jgi:hypothetical protein